MDVRKTGIRIIAILGSLAVMVILVLGTIQSGQRARRDTEQAVRSVSLLYLDELAGRREQVVENNLQDRIKVIHTALELMTPEDLSDEQHLQAYQARMKRLFVLERFAFVDSTGLVHTAQGIQSDVELYSFDYHTLSQPEISILTQESGDRRVIIAVPTDIAFGDTQLVVCYMEIDMQEMLNGVSMQTQNGATFCNIYTADGVALTNTVLGGLAVEDNLLEALRGAEYEPEYSYDGVARDFAEGNRGVVSFTYNGIRETLSYVPVEGTDWLLTYLIRESVISDSIRSISDGILQRSILQSALTVVVLLAVFLYIFYQMRRSAALVLEQEKALAESRVREADLEQRVALQEELTEALAAAEQANKAKTVFLSNMSHEIRTPMNAIIGLNSIALNDPSCSDQIREYLEQSDSSARHLLGIINDILDMSRIESGRMSIRNEEFSLTQSLEQVNTIISGQCRDKGVHYECCRKGRIDDYYIGDAMKLKEVMINILGNAVKFTPEGGSVRFQIEEGPRYDKMATLRFIISDTGIGMSPEFLPHLFDAFSQEDASTTNLYGSTGLGMPITKSIVELMNGHIEVESEKGKGTTFTVTVTLGESDRTDRESGETAAQGTGEEGPVSGETDASGTGEVVCEPIEATEEEPARTPVELEGRRMLLAEDVPVNAEIMKMILSMRGMEADLAENGRIAVDKFASHEPGYYDAVLMDMRMPEMDGLEATRRIRAMDRPDAGSIPIIALTANAFDEDVQRSLQAGLNAHLSKPVEPEALFETLEDLIRA